MWIRDCFRMRTESRNARFPSGWQLTRHHTKKNTITRIKLETRQTWVVHDCEIYVVEKFKWEALPPLIITKTVAFCSSSTKSRVEKKNGVPFAGGVGCYNQKTNEGKRQHKKFKPCEAQWSVRRIQADDAPDIVSNQHHCTHLVKCKKRQERGG